MLTDFPGKVGAVERLSVLSLRGATLVSRFMLTFVLARFLTPAELGLYGLFAASVGYALMVVGVDFYTFTTREIIKLDRTQWGRVLKGQAALALAMYGICLPLAMGLFALDALPWSMAGWLVLLLLLEHMAQELNRLLVAVSEQLWASVVLFLRLGAWVWGVVLLVAADPHWRDLDIVLGAWAVSSALSCLLGAARLHCMGVGGWRSQVDWSWIRGGLKIAVPLLLGTLALRGLFTVDRYAVHFLANPEVLGAYVLFVGIGNALMSFLDAGVFSFAYPGLVAAAQAKNADRFRHGMGRLLMHTLVLSVGFVVTAMLTIGLVLGWLDRPVYVQQLPMFPWVLLGMALFGLGMVPHYGLYAQGHDKPIVRSHFAGLLAFVAGIWLLGSYSPALAVPVALSLAMLLIGLLKTYAFFRLTPGGFIYSRPATGRVLRG
jgi:O-antigen/teichoic acid export membrane protein